MQQGCKNIIEKHLVISIIVFIFDLSKTNNMNNINGITAKDVTGMMNRLEKTISFYNKKYNFDLSLASAKEQKQYQEALNSWDFCKQKRDLLTFKK